MNYLDKVNRRDQIMQDSLKAGYVYKMTDGIFGIVVYRFPGSKKTELLCRMIDTDSVYEACEILNAEFAGVFKPADTDTRKWGETIMRAQGSARVLTDN